jgi:hypothetical protein
MEQCPALKTSLGLIVHLPTQPDPVSFCSRGEATRLALVSSQDYLGTRVRVIRVLCLKV